MRKVGDMKVYSFEELLEEDYGKVGTPERDAFEHSVDACVPCPGGTSSFGDERDW